MSTYLYLSAELGTGTVRYDYVKMKNSSINFYVFIWYILLLTSMILCEYHSNADILGMIFF